MDIASALSSSRPWTFRDISTVFEPKFAGIRVVLVLNVVQLACATVSDQDELEGGHVGRGVCGGGGGGGHLLVHAVLLVVQLWQRWPRVSEEGFRSE